MHCHPPNRGNVLQPVKMRAVWSRQQRERIPAVNGVRHLKKTIGGDVQSNWIKPLKLNLLTNFIALEQLF